MTTSDIFEKINKMLSNSLIPKGNEAMETYSIIDPHDKIFNMSFEEIIHSNNHK